MIKARAINKNTLEVIIVGRDFLDDLSRFRGAIPARYREYENDRKTWIVRNADQFLYVPWVRAAIEDYGLQLEMW